MALDPELLRRRQRVRFPRAPPTTLGKEAKGLGTADERLEKLLEELVALAERDTALAERETVFTSTLEKDRLLAALGYGGYCFTVNINVENQIAPGATVTTYLPVAPGFMFLPDVFEYWNSLLWVDNDLPAPPVSFLTRAPDHFIVNWEAIANFQRFLRYTVTNNHGVNTANFCAFHFFDVVTLDTWRMIELVYFDPLVNYVRDKAEKLSGRPYP